MLPKTASDEPATRNGTHAPHQDSDDSPDEYETFEELARKLLRVPKSELDEKRRAS